MKTTLLTSFITIALVAATSSFAVVIRAQVGADVPSAVPSAVPNTVNPAPIFSVVPSGLPVSVQPRELLVSGAEDDDNSYNKNHDHSHNYNHNYNHNHDHNYNQNYGNKYMPRHDDKDITDAQVLNFALALEQLEQAFYEHGLSHYSKEDFKKAGYPDWVRGRFEQMYEHEKTHVQFLESALTAAGAEVMKPCEYSFTDKSPREFIDFSEVLETVGTSAYAGSIQYISNDGYTTAAASILATEARHASWVNSAVRKQNPWNTAFETPLTINQVYTLASNFIHSCPKSNDLLLPSNIHAYPQLTLPPKFVPGKDTQLIFSSEKSLDHEHLYVAFLSGAATIFAPLNKKEDNYVVEIPGDLKAAGTVFVLVFKGGEDMDEARLDDESIVAGPAIAVFPFDSRGKYPAYGLEKRIHDSEN